MTNKQFSTAFTEAANYNDADAFVSDLALSSVWEDTPDAEIPQERIEQLRDIYTAAHRSVREIRAAAGMTQAELAAHFAMPKRTIENWEADGAAARSCAPYIRLMMQEALGLVRIERD